MPGIYKGLKEDVSEFHKLFLEAVRSLENEKQCSSMSRRRLESRESSSEIFGDTRHCSANDGYANIPSPAS